MGLQIRDERQMKALTCLSPAQFDSLLPIFSDLYRATQQHTYEEGSQAGTPYGQKTGDVSEVLVCYALGVYETQSNPQANRVIA